MKDILTNEDLDLRDIVKINMMGIEIFGYLCPEYQDKARRICYYTYSAFFVGLTYVACLLSQVADMVASYGDIEKMTTASFLTLTNVVQAFKLYVFIFHGSKVRQLLNSVNRKEFRPKNFYQVEVLHYDIKIAQLISKSWLLLVCVVCSLWSIFPLLTKDLDGRVHLPLSGWFPFNTDKSPIFETVYLYQTFTSFVNGLGVVCIDTFLMGLIIVISGQLRLLGNSLENMTECECDYNKPTIIRQNLVNNVVHYRNILWYAEEITNLFTGCIMAQFIVGVIISCITLFQLTLVSVASLQFVSMFLYEGGVLLEIYLWCYYGNEVILQSEHLLVSAYFCEWVDCSQDFKNDLLIFMTRSQIPLKLYAGGYFALSFPTFMAIAKSSWSYFAVLHRIHSN